MQTLVEEASSFQDPEVAHDVSFLMQVKNSKPNPSTHFSLEILAEAVVSLQNPESIQAAADPPNDEQVEERSEGKQQN